MNLWADVWTVMRKELLEIALMGGGGRRGWLSQLVLLGVFGVFMPLNIGRAWVESSLAVSLTMWLPYLLANATVTDAFAGERERHTLETLLASRLPDDAIFMGKWLAVMAYACGLTWVMMLVSLVVVNVTNWDGGLLLFPWEVTLGLVAGALLTGGFAASLGVLISLRAATVRQATQTMSYLVFVFIIPVLIFQFLPAPIQQDLIRALSRINIEQLVAGVAVFVAVLDAVLLALARANFRRARLTLD